MTRSIQIVLAAGIFLFLNCKSSDPMKLVYSDQNNNVYVVTSDRISYDPISESESSSGIYSGGEAFDASLEPSEYARIISLAEKIAKDPEGKSNKREMLTSVLTLVDGSKESAFILKRSELRTQLESLLKQHGE